MTIRPEVEQAAMLRAIELAARGLGRTSPNPAVGSVIVASDGSVVGEGWHAGSGQPHAEINALAQAGARANGATAVVTLEPCNHTGRTGPCTQALLAAGITRVVIAHRDPNPAAAGGGVEALRAAGVEVEVGLLAEAAQRVTGPWLTAVSRARPFVTWKFAASMDGRSAAADGSSRWITSELARRDVHELRATVDTVLVGVGTVLADDPALTVRLPGHQGPQPRRVVVDSKRRTPATARVLTDGAAPTWVVTSKEFDDGVGRVGLQPLLAALFEQGSRWVLLEGGPTLAGAMVRAGLVDEVVAYVAPALLGAGPAAFGEAGIGTISEALRLADPEVTMIGDDIRVKASFRSHQ